MTTAKRRSSADTTMGGRMTASILMMLLLIVVLQLHTVTCQPLEYCDDKPCRIPVNSQSCAQLKKNNDFLGTCCHLQDIQGTGGCRVVVSGPGATCGWTPKCPGTCPTGSGCNIQYQTASTEECGSDRYNVLTNPSGPITCESPEAEASEPAPSPTSQSSSGVKSTKTTRTFKATAAYIIVSSTIMVVISVAIY